MQQKPWINMQQKPSILGSGSVYGLIFRWSDKALIFQENADFQLTIENFKSSGTKIPNSWFPTKMQKK